MAQMSRDELNRLNESLMANPPEEILVARGAVRLAELEYKSRPSYHTYLQIQVAQRELDNQVKLIRDGFTIYA